MEQPDLSALPFLIGWLPTPAEQESQRMMLGTPISSQPSEMWGLEVVQLFHSTVPCPRDLRLTLYMDPGAHTISSVKGPSPVPCSYCLLSLSSFPQSDCCSLSLCGAGEKSSERSQRFCKARQEFYRPLKDPDSHPSTGLSSTNCREQTFLDYNADLGSRHSHLGLTRA